ncbi:unnamed protein product, partial [Timema podura]|nr:unnamed protein product [Timema podura]
LLFQYEHYNTLYIHSWVPMHWMDQRLKWEPSKFSDQSFLHIDFDAIWIPDIMVYTASDMRESSPLSSSEMKCITYSDGTVTCVPSIAFSAKCVSDVRRWPYDVQNCSMRIGSQTYSGQDLDIHTINAN